MKLTIRAENPDSQAVASAAGTANGEKKSSPQSLMVPPSGSPEPEPIRSKGWSPASPARMTHSDSVSGPYVGATCLYVAHCLRGRSQGACW